MVYRVFLTGGDAGRRTSLLIRALSDLRVISGGWVKLTLSGGAERVPGLVEPREAAAAELPLAASVAAREECPNHGLHDRILSRLGADEGTLLLDADALDYGALIARLREWDVNILDWAHHRKFDPQMKLRARRRKSIFPE